jgi:hypothetical protein
MTTISKQFFLLFLLIASTSRAIRAQDVLKRPTVLVEDAGELEAAPLAVAFFLLGISALFTLWVIADVCVSGRRRSQADDTYKCNVSDQEESSLAPPDQQQERQQDEQQNKCSVVVSWRNISCTYEATKQSQRDTTTLSKSQGVMRAGELTAIMGPR